VFNQIDYSLSSNNLLRLLRLTCLYTFIGFLVFVLH
jgi:hypothetical protein